MSELKRRIVDATIAVKWFVRDETACENADDLLLGFTQKSFELHAPSVFRFEVVGALKRACTTKKQNRWRIERPQAQLAIEELFSLPIRLHETTVSDATEAFDMACRFSKGYYDMLYLQLAQTLNCQLITADERMLHAVPADFPRERICLLADWAF